ncbi:MAG: tetratricopeptide repeat protein [Acidobacteriota bacterium]|nr:MAG: tetratricopeptide repeat protein [Acidobacteriota bacterium]
MSILSRLVVISGLVFGFALHSSNAQSVQELFQGARGALADEEFEKAESDLRHALGLSLNSLGLAYARTGNGEMAEIALKEAVSASIINDRALLNLVKFYLKSDQVELGTEAVEKLLEINPIHPEGRHLLGLLHLVGGNPNAASHVLRDAYLVASKNRDVGVSLVSCYVALENEEEALQIINELTAEGSGMGALKLRLGRVFLERGAFEKAVEYLRGALSDDLVNRVEAAHYLSQALLGAGQSEEAAALKAEANQFQKADASVLWEGLIEDPAGKPEEIPSLRKSSAFAYGKLGEVGMQTGSYRRAAGQIERALFWDSEMPGLNLLLGLARFRGELVVEAVEPVREALRRHPGNPQALQLLVQITIRLADIGQMTEARETVDYLLTQAPETSYLFVLRGRIRGESDDVEGALEDFSRALELNPNVPEVHYNIGVLHLQSNRLDEAVAEFERELEVNPSHEMAMIRKAAVLVDGNRGGEALPLLQSALELDPELGPAYALRGRIQLRMGQANEAIVSLERASRLEPENAAVFLDLSTAYGEAGRQNDAEAALERHRALMGNQ